MSLDELLRMKQITGVAGLFADRDFSAAWEAEAEAGDNVRTEADHDVDEDFE